MNTFHVVIKGDLSGEIELLGRGAWTMRQLIAAWPRGVTSIDDPAPRWSHYVWILRGYGLDIHHRFSGAFLGNRGCYVLRSAVSVREAGHA